MQDPNTKIAARNRVALITFIVSKVFGFAALVSFFINDAVGFFMLALYAGLLVITIGLCLTNVRAFNKKEMSDKELLRRMKDEGTLKSYLEDIGY